MSEVFLQMVHNPLKNKEFLILKIEISFTVVVLLIFINGDDT